ncbi:hypothetical protein QM012_001196 [Aureobasidium pullulans]|uniref:RING-type domain-containing protein n=1 Tax=Aureobasidium pullulans TaxID=5580 RepID=A0ABR0THG4_AURPU
MTDPLFRKIKSAHDDSEPQVLHTEDKQSTDSHHRSSQCDCCFETVSSKKTVQLPGCGHTYCTDCLRVMYRMAINNEADFPPSCCSGTIDIASVKHLLHRPQILAFERCAVEYSTPELERIYCADTRCSFFLGRANNGILRCGKCSDLTCTSCKDYAHPGECKEERGRDINKLDADLERLAAAEGWQRCPSCSRLVVLDSGCNHITCRCKHQFCYICGAKWKTCFCQQWQEAHLQERLRQEEQDAVLQPPPPRNNLELFEMRLRQAENEVREMFRQDPLRDLRRNGYFR